MHDFTSELDWSLKSVLKKSSDTAHGALQIPGAAVGFSCLRCRRKRSNRFGGYNLPLKTKPHCDASALFSTLQMMVFVSVFPNRQFPGGISA